MIPLATTKISVRRTPEPNLYDEPYSGTEQSTRTVEVEGVRAVIDRPSGTLDLAGGQQNIANYGLVCDPVNLGYSDEIYDETSGRSYKITWFMAYPDHVEAGLRDVEGEV